MLKLITEFTLTSTIACVDIGQNILWTSNRCWKTINRPTETIEKMMQHTWFIQRGTVLYNYIIYSEIILIMYFPFEVGISEAVEFSYQKLFFLKYRVLSKKEWSWILCNWRWFWTDHAAPPLYISPIMPIPMFWLLIYNPKEHLLELIQTQEFGLCVRLNSFFWDI